MVDPSKIWRKISSNSRIIIVFFILVFMLFALAIMLAPRSAVAHYGKVTLSSEDLHQNDLISLDGDWEFYWDQLLTPEDFIGENSPQADSLMTVPGAWDKNAAYLGHGVATYRLIMNYPVMLKDPALSIKTGIGATTNDSYGTPVTFYRQRSYIRGLLFTTLYFAN